MTLIIESATCDRLARELAELTGESIDIAVTKALEVRLAQARQDHDHRKKVPNEVNPTRLGELFARLRAPESVLDPRPADEILGYDEDGIWR